MKRRKGSILPGKVSLDLFQQLRRFGLLEGAPVVEEPWNTGSVS